RPRRADSRHDAQGWYHRPAGRQQAEGSPEAFRLAPRSRHAEVGLEFLLLHHARRAAQAASSVWLETTVLLSLQPLAKRSTGGCMFGKRLFATAIGLTLVFSAAAQTPTAQVTGRITDSSDAVVPGASVVLVNAETGLIAKAASNDTGYY